MKFGLDAGKLQARHHVRCLHEAEVKNNADNASADRFQPDAVLRLDAWRVGGNHGDEQHTFVQDAIVSKMMCQAKRYALACCCEDRSRSGQTDGRSIEHPSNELVLTLSQLGTLVLKQPPSGTPGQHEKRDGARQQKWKPAAFEQLGRVRRDKNQIDDEEKSVYGHDDEQVVAPSQRDQGGQHGRDCHQHRNGDAVGAPQRVR